MELFVHSIFRTTRYFALYICFLVYISFSVSNSHKFGRSTFARSLILKFEMSVVLKFYCSIFWPSSLPVSRQKNRSLKKSHVNQSWPPHKEWLSNRGFNCTVHSVHRLKGGTLWNAIKNGQFSSFYYTETEKDRKIPFEISVDISLRLKKKKFINKKNSKWRTYWASPKAGLKKYVFSFTRCRPKLKSETYKWCIKLISKLVSSAWTSKTI